MSFICEYCDKSFVREAAFEAHYCEKMQRKGFLETDLGKIAFIYYKEWLRLSKGAANVSAETFLGSRYFLSFVRFIKYSNKMLLPDALSFIKFMVSKDLLPLYWCMDSIYIEYIQNLDKTYTPEQQVIVTKRTLFELADIFGCKPNEIFNYLQAGDCIKLLKTRKLSPWVLLLSKRFQAYITLKLSAEQRSIITGTVINPSLWKKKFEANPEEVQRMKKVVADLGL
jgi:hypothetical protein